MSSRLVTAPLLLTAKYATMLADVGLGQELGSALADPTLPMGSMRDMKP